MTADRDLYPQIAARLPGQVQAVRPLTNDRLTIGQAAQAAGTTADVLRAWSTRYGWPSPPRSGAGYRLFSRHEVRQIQWVLTQRDLGRPMSALIVDGKPATQPTAVSRAAPVTTLDFNDLDAPRTREADDVRRLLILAITQRHPGCVRWALALRLRLSPVDREAAVDGILRIASERLGHPGWLLEAMHA